MPRPRFIAGLFMIAIGASRSSTLVDLPRVERPPPRALLDPARNFDLLPPRLEVGVQPIADPQDAVVPGSRPLTLWATHYSVRRIKARRDGVPILDLEGRELGPRVSERDFCRAALNGSVEITPLRGEPRLWTFAGVAGEEQVDCRVYTPKHPALGRTRFRLRNSVKGAGYRLVPFRSIAVDPDTIPLGSVLYVPSARGEVIILEDGAPRTHDGYFFAADTGGGIDGDHIDVFLGFNRKSPFDFIGSAEHKTFDAFLIDDAEIAAMFERAHAVKPR